MNILQQIEQGFEGLELGVPAGQPLYGVMPGDTVRVSATIKYRGPACDDVFYAAIGNRVAVGIISLYFDEYWEGAVPVHFNQSNDFVSYPMVVDVPITQIALFPWTPGLFDLYCKLDVAEAKAGYPEVDDYIEIILRSEWSAFTIVSYDRIAGA